MNDPFRIVEPDWESFQDLDYARKLLDICQKRGIVKNTQADEIRFWAARSFAMRKGRSPSRYFYWLLINPESLIPTGDEEAAMQEVKRINEDRDGDPGMIGEANPLGDKQ